VWHFTIRQTSARPSLPHSYLSQNRRMRTGVDPKKIRDRSGPVLNRPGPVLNRSGPVLNRPGPEPRTGLVRTLNVFS